MSVRHLASLFRPRSVAVIGATLRPHAVGGIVMRNLLQGGFAGPVMPVNPKHAAIEGVLAYPDVAALPVVPDLAILCTPPAAVPDIIDQLGRRGTKAAVLVSSGMTFERDDGGATLQDRAAAVARLYGMRLLGANSLGLQVPGLGLNASFVPQQAQPGKIAFISQSGAICSAVLDWAHPKGIGFSHFISLGNAADIDFGDVLDYLGSDPSTRAILLHIESIHQRRNFMSAARAAARNKPVLCIKSGRSPEGASAAASHSGALAGSDEVYDAAIRRAGMLRVYDFDELFAAVETLARSRPLRGQSLGIVTNGGGMGVMAADDLVEGGGKVARLSAETIDKLNVILPPAWPRANPVDIIGDADGERYVKTMDCLAEAPEVDALLMMHAPTAMTSGTEIAEAVIRGARNHVKTPVMACWVGDEAAQPARRLFAEAGIPSYETPEKAIQSFLHLVEYRRNQDLLMETPPSAPSGFTPDTAAARAIIDANLAAGVSMLSDPESKAVLAAYGIPVMRTVVARNPAEASRIARSIEGAVALKILSPDISHKSDVGGVVLELMGPFEVEKAANAMLDRVRAANPAARIDGFTVQEMARRPGAQELIVGVATDPVFGPVILFGHGGTGAEVIADRAVALPPLNMRLARELISRTRVSRLLAGYSDRPPADLDALCLTLMQVSQLLIDVPEIVELDINPLFADAKGVLALDARIRVAPTAGRASQLAIRPYPQSLEEIVALDDGRTIQLRPIRPEDEPNHHIFVSKLTHEDIRFRFFGLVSELPHSEMARMTQIDYDREMAFIAVMTIEGHEETMGVVRTVTDPDNEKAEFAIVVRSDIKGLGLGKLLLQKMIDYCRSRGTRSIVGQVLQENTRMMHLIENLGFRRLGVIDGDVAEVCLQLEVSSSDTAAP